MVPVFDVTKCLKLLNCGSNENYEILHFHMNREAYISAMQSALNYCCQQSHLIR